VHEINLVYGLDVRPIGFSLYVINDDVDHVSLAVLTFFLLFDPRLVLVVLYLMFECDFQVKRQNTLRRWIHI
jgi:hypothetical protein